MPTLQPEYRRFGVTLLATCPRVCLKLENNQRKTFYLSYV
jgi:hypothetical protein